MKIVTCLKDVPGRDTRYQIGSGQNWINESDVTWEINECDEYALEEALKLKESLGGEVTLLTLGPQRSEKAMRKGLAMGADRGVHVVDTASRVLSPYPVAKALAAALEKEEFDLILAGTQSDDFSYAQTGVVLADLLGLPHATIVMEVAVDSDAKTVRVLREMESGWFQWVRLPLPAVLTIQAGISKVRYPSLKGIMQARRKEIRQINLEELGLDWEHMPSLEILSLAFPETDSKVEILEGPPETAVDALVDKLRREAKVL